MIIFFSLQDPACEGYSQALLYFKGYHAIQVQRIAHSLWHAGRRILALALQSRGSEVLAVDIHPAAKLGKGVLLDHGTGVVIGETAEVGNNVSILQNVTLGGTGKEHGDRHPKVSDNVLIGANATVLGNIRIGKGAQVAAGSLVLKAVPPKTMVAGSPAKEVGRVSGNPALNMDQWAEGAKSAIEKPCDDIFGTAVASAGPNKQIGKSVAAPAPPSFDGKSTQEAVANGANKAAPASAVNVPAAKDVASSNGAERNLRKGAPPAMKEPVEAVTSDKAAKKKWGTKKNGEDVEYFI